MEGISIEHGVLTVSLHVDSRVQRAVRESFHDQKKGMETSVAAITKAMGDFGFDVKKDGTKALQEAREKLIAARKKIAIEGVETREIDTKIQAIDKKIQTAIEIENRLNDIMNARSNGEIEIITPQGVRFKIKFDVREQYREVRQMLERNNALKKLSAQAREELADLERGFTRDEGQERILNQHEKGMKLEDISEKIFSEFARSAAKLDDGRTVQKALLDIANVIENVKSGKATPSEIAVIKKTLDAIFFATGNLQQSTIDASLQRAHN